MAILLTPHSSLCLNFAIDESVSRVPACSFHAFSNLVYGGVTYGKTFLSGY